MLTNFSLAYIASAVMGAFAPTSVLCTETCTAQSTSEDPGVVVIENGNEQNLRQSIPTIADASIGFQNSFGDTDWTRNSARVFLRFSGSQASAQITTSLPVFHATIPSAIEPTDLIFVVELDTDSTRREVLIATTPIFSTVARIGFRNSDLIPTQFQILEDSNEMTRYQISLTEELDPDEEYAFVILDPSQEVRERFENAQYYPFGVD
jgi:hypothetical protein